MAYQVDVREVKRMLASVGPGAAVNCAVASNGHDAWLKLDRTRSPKKLLDELLKELQAEGAKSGHAYFGTASPDASRAIVTLSLNKPAPGGLARSLIVALRGSGYHKVQFDNVNTDVA